MLFAKYLLVSRTLILNTVLEHPHSSTNGLFKKIGRRVRQATLVNILAGSTVRDCEDDEEMDGLRGFGAWLLLQSKCIILLLYRSYGLQQ